MDQASKFLQVIWEKNSFRRGNTRVLKFQKCSFKIFQANSAKQFITFMNTGVHLKKSNI